MDGLDRTGCSHLDVRVGLHNQVHPRTDAVVIMAVVNPTNDKILLGRNVSGCALIAFGFIVLTH